MIDRLLVRRHPQPKPSDDWFMLDRWTSEIMHTMSSVYREVKDQEGRVVDRVYRTVCLCGWRSLEWHKAALDSCPVGDALRERAKRVRKDGERLIWKEVGDVSSHQE